MSTTPKRMKSRTVRDEWKTVLAAVEAGQEIVVERYNQPVAKIIPYKEAPMPTVTKADIDRYADLRHRYANCSDAERNDPAFNEITEIEERISDRISEISGYTREQLDAMNDQMAYPSDYPVYEIFECWADLSFSVNFRGAPTEETVNEREVAAAKLATFLGESAAIRKANARPRKPTFDPARFALGIETEMTPVEYLQMHYPELVNLTDDDIYPGGNLARVIFTVELDGEWICAGMPYTNGAMEVYRRGTKAAVLKELDDILGG